QGHHRRRQRQRAPGHGRPLEVSPLAPRTTSLRTKARARLEDGPSSPEALASHVFGFAGVDRRTAERLLGVLLGEDPAFERRDGRWSLSPPVSAGATRSLAEIPFVVVDVETTGGLPPGDRLIEIAAVRLRGGRFEGEWSSLLDPGRAIPWFVERLTGIDGRMTAAAPPFAAVADDFLDFLGGCPFVAHNAGFDWRFVNAELLLARGGRLTNAKLCTVRLARRLLPHVRRRNLDALAHLFGVTVHGRHRALGDARATARILLRLLEVAGERGVVDEAGLAELAGVGGTLWPDGRY
ncbi:MAG: 3'-5' exonuclease, partial [Gemmatimonadetes bacterium]|nr:3'-5' exonuclease [Gemmatimonadota bacterium]